MNEIKIAKEKFDLLDNFPLGIFVLKENYQQSTDKFKIVS